MARRKRVAGKRRWLLLGLIALLALGACTSDDREMLDVLEGEDSPQDVRRQRTEILDEWLTGLRAEADWLWESAVVAEQQPARPAERCPAPAYSHTPLTLTNDERAEDDVSARMVDLLVYAEQLIDQAHVQWDTYCDNQVTAATAVAFIRSRLNPAYSSLDAVAETLELRKERLAE